MNTNIFWLTKKRANTNMNMNIRNDIREYKYEYEYSSHTDSDKEHHWKNISKLLSEQSWNDRKDSFYEHGKN